MEKVKVETETVTNSAFSGSSLPPSTAAAVLIVRRGSCLRSWTGRSGTEARAREIEILVA